MQVIRHALPAPCPGTQRDIVSFHYGTPGGRKAYLQASLHADELPGMLVAHHLRSRLAKLEEAGRIDGEIVVVPVANPIGISQTIQGSPFGRFDLASGINFNRGYKHLTPKLKEALRDRLGPDPDANVRVIRGEALRLLDGWQPLTETEAMKKTLLTLAVDADVALDLHCDHEAMMHVYTGTPLVARGKPLAQLLGAHAVLTARESGDDPFDEACSRTWWELAEHFGPAFPIPHACFSATVELRGELDVRHDYAERDADALVAFLTHEGFIQGDAPALPAPLCEATPLEGVEPIAVPHGGLLVFVRDIGQHVDRGTVIAELIDPVSGETTPLRTTVAGVFFARTRARFVQRGMRIAKIAGAVPFRTGKLMGE